jgi:uncharacterized protein YndB with AHSA1/START domain
MAGIGTGSEPGLRLRRTIAAPREWLWRAWTEEEGLRRWHAPGEATVAHVEVDLRVGGKWRVHMRGPDGTEYHVEGEYREIDAPERLVYTWHWTHSRDEETVVTVEFHERDGVTEIVLTHVGFLSDESRARHEEGWGGCLAKLETSDLEPGS